MKLGRIICIWILESKGKQPNNVGLITVPVSALLTTTRHSACNAWPIFWGMCIYYLNQNIIILKYNQFCFNNSLIQNNIKNKGSWYELITFLLWPCHPPLGWNCLEMEAFSETVESKLLQMWMLKGIKWASKSASDSNGCNFLKWRYREEML